MVRSGDDAVPGKFGLRGFKDMPTGIEREKSQAEINYPTVKTVRDCDVLLKQLAIDKGKGLKEPWPAMIAERLEQLLDLRLILMVKEMVQ
jgi:hypothetical protein